MQNSKGDSVAAIDHALRVLLRDTAGRAVAALAIACPSARCPRPRIPELAEALVTACETAQEVV